MAVPSRLPMSSPTAKRLPPASPPHPRSPQSPRWARAVTCQSGSAGATVTDTAQVRRGRARLAALWSETWRIWYPAGVDDPSCAARPSSPSAAEYWANSGSKGLPYLVKAATAYLLGERMETDEAHAHAKVLLNA
jgi:hypothetical protein